MDNRTGNAEKISALAAQILRLAHDDILIHLRFFDTALAGLPLQEKPNIGCFATDGAKCCYDPVFVLQKYREQPELSTLSTTI